MLLLIGIDCFVIKFDLLELRNMVVVVIFFGKLVCLSGIIVMNLEVFFFVVFFKRLVEIGLGVIVLMCIFELVNFWVIEWVSFLMVNLDVMYDEKVLKF